jgi:hypothetical protein
MINTFLIKLSGLAIYFIKIHRIFVAIINKQIIKEKKRKRKRSNSNVNKLNFLNIKSL